MLNFRRVYIGILIIFIILNLLLFLCLQPFIYTLCGYNPKLVSRITAEAFEAYKNTGHARIVFYKLLLFWLGFTTFFSFLAIWLRMSPRLLGIIPLVLCGFLLLLFGFVIHLRGPEGMELLGI